jgi:hypothetical protein
LLAVACAEPAQLLPDAGGAADAGMAIDAGPRIVAVPLSGSAPLYLATVTFGGAQNLQLALDTGSTSAAVASVDCVACRTAGVSPLFMSDAGSFDTGIHVGATFGGGSGGQWSGEVLIDSLQVGAAPPVQMGFVAITSQEGFFVPNSGEGILGLGPSDLLLRGTSSVLDKLVEQGLADIFALQMCSNGGTLWFGGFDAAATGPPQYAPMLPHAPGSLSSRAYALNVAAVAFDGTTFDSADAGYGPGIVDTGGDIFLLPKPMFYPLAAAIGANETFKAYFPGGATWLGDVGNCVAVERSPEELDAVLPALTVVLGSNPGTSLSVRATDGYLLWYTDSGKNYYCPGVAWADFPFFDIGGDLLRGFITIFDRTERRIGFASTSSCPAR